MTTTRKTPRPLFSALSDEALVQAYHDTRTAHWNAFQCRMKGGVVARLGRDLDIIVGLARKRGVKLH
jgi:hypothetical protein